MDYRRIDVREYSEYAAGHIDGSEWVPLSTLEKQAEFWDREQPLTLVCRTGRRSEEARQMLAAKGFHSLDVLSGGVEAWKASGKRVIVSGHRPWAMERQVRVLAGSLVVAFVGLGATRSSRFLIGAGLIGAGLVYAGISDTCMMGSVLGRLPWNRPVQTAL